MVKKYLPLILFLAGILVFAGVYFFVIRGKKAEVPEEEPVTEIPLEKRPVTSLTPSADGHWLKLEIKDIKIEAASLDYELLYKVGDGRTQGVPGTIKLEGQKSIERDLLLGSESSGKFRYDVGVETGSLTLRFRNQKGKLVGKLLTDFHLQSGVTTLTSVDGKFKYTLSQKAPKTFFVTMQTFGTPEESAVVAMGSGYAIFASDSLAHPGQVESQ